MYNWKLIDGIAHSYNWLGDNGQSQVNTCSNSGSYETRMLVYFFLPKKGKEKKRKKEEEKKSTSM